MFQILSIIIVPFISSKRATNHQEVALQEDLNIEYEKLLSSYKVLKVVEGHFKDNFDAKGFLSEIFMVYNLPHTYACTSNLLLSYV